MKQTSYRTTAFEDLLKKIENVGTQGLSDADLLSVVLGVTSAQKVDLNKVLEVMENTTKYDVDGLGPAQMNKMKCLVEMLKRAGNERHLRITGPSDVVPRLLHFADRPQETFIVVTLDGAQQVKRIIPVTVGLLNRTLIHPREVFQPAIEDRAASIIIAHTHPSGSLEPSREDRDATTRLSNAGKLLGIEVLDHLILSHRGYYSFRENGDCFI